MKFGVSVRCVVIVIGGIMWQTKSMGEHLLKADKLMLPRKMRFTKQFMDDLMSLVSMVTRDVIDRCVQVCNWMIDIVRSSSWSSPVRFSVCIVSWHGSFSPHMMSDVRSIVANCFLLLKCISVRVEYDILCSTAGCHSPFNYHCDFHILAS